MWELIGIVWKCVGKYLIEQDAQLSQRDRAAGCVIVFAKTRRLELGDNIFTNITGLSSTTNIFGLKICRIR